jgi:hypothetical protein
MSIPVEVEVPPLDNEPGPSEAVAIEPKLPKKQQLKQRRKARHFYFNDCRVVLQASHSIAVFILTLFTISLDTGGWTDVQNPSLLPDSGVSIFQRFLLAPSAGGLRKRRGFGTQDTC